MTNEIRAALCKLPSSIQMCNLITEDHLKITGCIMGATRQICFIQRKHTHYRKKRITVFESSHPWLRDDEYKALNFEKTLIKRKTVISEAEIQKIRELNDKLKERYLVLREQYYVEMISSLGSDRQKFFGTMASRTRDKNALPSMMTYEGKQLFGENRFIALASHLQKCFASPSIHIRSGFFNFVVDIKEIYMQNWKIDHILLWTNFTPTFTLEEIKKCIRQIDNKKDCGPMGISPLVFKYHHAELAPFLVDTYNRIMETGFIPQDWKLNDITPIPKKGVRSEVSNYRGVAMQSIISKFFDNLCTMKLYSHVSEAIAHTQHGFQRNRGT